MRQGIFGQLRTGVKGRGGFKERSGDDHDGIDIRAPQGSEVYANRDGQVVQAITQKDGYGNRVIIKHEVSGSTKQVVYTHYAHLKSFLPGIDPKATKVFKVIQVKEGQLIGYSGATGNAEGQPTSEDHVHFGVSLSERPAQKSKDWINPVKYLNKAILTNKE